MISDLEICLPPNLIESHARERFSNFENRDHSFKVHHHNHVHVASDKSKAHRTKAKLQTQRVLIQTAHALMLSVAVERGHGRQQEWMLDSDMISLCRNSESESERMPLTEISGNCLVGDHSLLGTECQATNGCKLHRDIMGLSDRIDMTLHQSMRLKSYDAILKTPRFGHMSCSAVRRARLDLRLGRDKGSKPHCWQSPNPFLTRHRTQTSSNDVTVPSPSLHPHHARDGKTEILAGGMYYRRTRSLSPPAFLPSHDANIADGHERVANMDISRLRRLAQTERQELYRARAHAAAFSGFRLLWRGLAYRLARNFDVHFMTLVLRTLGRASRTIAILPAFRRWRVHAKRVRSLSLLRRALLARTVLKVFRNWSRQAASRVALTLERYCDRETSGASSCLQTVLRSTEGRSRWRRLQMAVERSQLRFAMRAWTLATVVTSRHRVVKARGGLSRSILATGQDMENLPHAPCIVRRRILGQCKAFVAWNDRARYSRWVSKVLKSAQARRHYRLLGTALKQWQRVVVVRRERRCRLLLDIFKLWHATTLMAHGADEALVKAGHRRRLIRTLGAWCNIASLLHDVDLGVDRVQRNIERRLCRRSMIRWTRRILTIRCRREATSVLHRCCKRASTSTVLTQWWALVRRHRYNVDIQRNVLCAWQRCYLLRKGVSMFCDLSTRAKLNRQLRAWRDHTVTTRRLTTIASQVPNVLHRWRLLWATRAWVLGVQRRWHARAAATACTRSVRLSALRRWAAHVALSRLRKDAVRLNARRRRRCMHATLLRWRAHAKGSANIRRVMLRLEQKRRLCVLRCLLETWRAYAKQVSADQAISMKIAVSTHRRLCRQLVLMHWAQYSRYCHTLYHNHMTISDRWRRKVLKACHWQWVHWVVSSRRETRAPNIGRLHALRRNWVAWRLMAQKNVRRSNAILVRLGRTSQRYAFVNWRSLALWKRHIRVQCSAMQLRHVRRLSKSVFSSWRQAAASIRCHQFHVYACVFDKWSILLHECRDIRNQESRAVEYLSQKPTRLLRIILARWRVFTNDQLGALPPSPVCPTWSHEHQRPTCDNQVRALSASANHRDVTDEISSRIHPDRCRESGQQIHDFSHVPRIERSTQAARVCISLAFGTWSQWTLMERAIREQRRSMKRQAFGDAFDNWALGGAWSDLEESESTDVDNMIIDMPRSAHSAVVPSHRDAAVVAKSGSDCLGHIVSVDENHGHCEGDTGFPGIGDLPLQVEQSYEHTSVASAELEHPPSPRPAAAGFKPAAVKASSAIASPSQSSALAVDHHRDGVQSKPQASARSCHDSLQVASESSRHLSGRWSTGRQWQLACASSSDESDTECDDAHARQPQPPSSRTRRQEHGDRFDRHAHRRSTASELERSLIAADKSMARDAMDRHGDATNVKGTLQNVMLSESQSVTAPVPAPDSENRPILPTMPGRPIRPLSPAPSRPARSRNSRGSTRVSDPSLNGSEMAVKGIVIPVPPTVTAAFTSAQFRRPSRDVSPQHLSTTRTPTPAAGPLSHHDDVDKSIIATLHRADTVGAIISTLTRMGSQSSVGPRTSESDWSKSSQAQSRSPLAVALGTRYVRVRLILIMGSTDTRTDQRRLHAIQPSRTHYQCPLSDGRPGNARGGADDDSQSDDSGLGTRCMNIDHSTSKGTMTLVPLTAAGTIFPAPPRRPAVLHMGDAIVQRIEGPLGVGLVGHAIATRKVLSVDIAIGAAMRVDGVDIDCEHADATSLESRENLRLGTTGLRCAQRRGWITTAPLMANLHRLSSRYTDHTTVTVAGERRARERSPCPRPRAMRACVVTADSEDREDESHLSCIGSLQVLTPTVVEESRVAAVCNAVSHALCRATLD